MGREPAGQFDLAPESGSARGIGTNECAAATAALCGGGLPFHFLSGEGRGEVGIAHANSPGVYICMGLEDPNLDPG